MTTGTELPPPSQLPEVHVDPQMLRQLALSAAGKKSNDLCDIVP